MADIQQGDANIKQSIDINTRVNKRFISKVQPNLATPSVKDLEHIILSDSVPTTHTNFKNGRDGQPLQVISTNGNATIANNANIATNTGANKLLTANLVYRFTYHKLTGKWHEDA
jgi:hypothetical protein